MVLFKSCLKWVHDFFFLAKQSTTWSYANWHILINFSRTLARKHGRDIGQKSDIDNSTVTFFSAMIHAFFLAGGKNPLASDVLINLVRKDAITGNALATMLWCMPSSPFIWVLKCNTVRITSGSGTGEKLNPSDGAVIRMLNDSAESSWGEITMLEK